MCPYQEILAADGKWDFEAGILTCSAHEWQFDLRDGSRRQSARLQIFRYEVRKDGEDILIGVPTDGRLRRLRHQSQQDA